MRGKRGTGIGLHAGAIDVRQQRVDRGLAPCGIRTGPLRVAETATGLSLRELSETENRFVNDDGSGAFRDGVPGSQNPRRPSVVALEYCGGGERDQRVRERELVLELADTDEAVAHPGD